MLPSVIICIYLLSCSALSSSINEIEISNFINYLDVTDTISSELSIFRLTPLVCIAPYLYQKSVDYRSIHASVSSVYTKHRNQFPSERSSKIWNNFLKNAQSTLKYNTKQCISTMGLLSKHYKTVRYHLQYKQLCCRHVPFYVDYLNVGAKYVKVFVGGTLYTNKLFFKKFFTCFYETS